MQQPIEHGLQWDPLFSFEAYLRTGRLVRCSSVSPHAEVKFNPWHDPDDGRFTFAGTGRYFGGSDRSSFRPGGGSFGGGGATGSLGLPKPNVPTTNRRPPRPSGKRPIATTPSIATPKGRDWGRQKRALGRLGSASPAMAMTIASIAGGGRGVHPAN